MTDGMEQAIENIFAGVMFCMAIAMILWLHGAFMENLDIVGKEPEQLILFENTGE